MKQLPAPPSPLPMFSLLRQLLMGLMESVAGRAPGGVQGCERLQRGHRNLPRVKQLRLAPIEAVHPGALGSWREHGGRQPHAGSGGELSCSRAGGGQGWQLQQLPWGWAGDGRSTGRPTLAHYAPVHPSLPQLTPNCCTLQSSAQSGSLEPEP